LEPPNTQTTKHDEAMKIIVLGAGVIGVTTAYYLNKLGFDVTVIDRNKQSAAECSYANGGQLSYSHAEPWATPAALKKIPKWLITKDSPLVFHPSRDLNMWQWALKFLAHCTNAQKEQATRNTLRLAMHSRDCFAEIIKETGIEFSYLDKGTLHTFRDEKSMAANIGQAEFQKQLGCDYQILNTRKDCEKIEPALKYAPAKIIGGIFFPIDASGDINQFTLNLTKYLEGKGVAFAFGENIKEILTDGERVTGVRSDVALHNADNFVVSLGAATPILLRKIGINAPIYPMKGYSLSVDIADSAKAPTVSITDQYNKIVYSRLGSVLRIAGTAEFDGYNDTVSANRIGTLKRMVQQLFPECGNINTGRPWACLRPSTPDGAPIIGKTKYKNLYMNTGHGTLGWTLSCGSASIVSEIISTKGSLFDLNGLSLAKY